MGERRRCCQSWNRWAGKGEGFFRAELQNLSGGSGREPSPARRTPTANDLAGLLCAFQSAEESLPEIRVAGGYPIYPKAIKNFTGFLSLSPWHDTAYGRFPIKRVFDHPEEATEEEITAALTAVTRMERFSPGGLKSLFTEGTIRRLVNRALELGAQKPAG